MGDDGGGPRAEHSFASCYMEMCRQLRQRPLPMICVTLPHSLELTTDRVKMDEWTPILNSLALDRSLKAVCVRSKYNQGRRLLEEASSESAARAAGGRKQPLVLTRFLVEWLAHSVAQCCRYSGCLASLELEGIPVPADCLAVLCVGLAASRSLRRLSLRRCYIGDAGCELLCRTIGELRCVRELDLGACELGPGSGPSLAAALSRQKLQLYHDAWKQSLRYREPKLDSMPGLRRLSLNANPKLGSDAVAGIIEAIRDSLWFRALDLQQCGLSDELGRSVVQLLEHNHSLVVVDLRLNPAIRDDTLDQVHSRLERNGLQASGEFPWLALPSSGKSEPTNPTKRVASAGSLRQHHRQLPSQQQQQQQQPQPRPRPRSAMLRQVKRPLVPSVVPSASKKPLLAQVHSANRLRPRPHTNPAPSRPLKALPLRQAPQPAPRDLQVESKAKVCLHLDLQSQIVCMAEQAIKEQQQKQQQPEQEQQPDELGDEENEQMEEEEEEEEAEEDENTMSLLGQEEEEEEEEEELSRQLDEMRVERERLVAELTEERSRRQFAEAKLHSATCELAEIRRRFALIIRRTKSESLKRGAYLADDGLQLVSPKPGRSEGDVRVEPTPRPVQPERLDRRMAGDDPGNPAAAATTTASLDKPDLQDRARSIFRSILDGDARFDIADADLETPRSRP